jgi:L-iditol 2-dehydrogenase
VCHNLRYFSRKRQRTAALQDLAEVLVHNPSRQRPGVRLSSAALRCSANSRRLRSRQKIHFRAAHFVAINKRMRAAVLYGKEDVRVEEITPVPLKSGEVRIAIEAALTCGTDLKVFKRGYHAKMIVPPAVFGHELAGVISESQAPDWRLGERVVVANSAPCGKCFYCQNNQENLCDDLLFLNGAYAESLVVPARIVQKNLLRLKAETEFRDAALVEPLSCVVQGVEDTQLREGQRVLVLGAGPIGLMFVALAKHLGCDVTVAGRRVARLEAARRLGATDVIDIGDGNNLVTRIREASKARFDAVLEAVGRPEVWESAVQLVRKGGTVNFFGGCPAGTTVMLDTTLLHYSNLTLLASFHHTPRTIRRALEFIEAGVVRSRDFVDGESSLTDLPALLKSMTSGNQAVKTLIRVHE